MNEKPLSGAQLAALSANVLRELLGKVSWLQNWTVSKNDTLSKKEFDWVVTIPVPKKAPVELLVECKLEPRPSQFPTISAIAKLAHEKSGRRIPILAAPSISERMAEVCREHNWNWFDLAGNCYLNIPGVIYLEISGKESVYHPPSPLANLSGMESSRILRVLLDTHNVDRRWTQRELQKACLPGVSIGLVNKVVRYLRDQAYIEDANDGGIKLRDPLGLLTDWGNKYRTNRSWKRTFFTLLQGRKLQEALAPLQSITNGKAAYALFSAAEFQAPHVRQPKTWLYLGSEFERAIDQLADIKEVDSGENLVVYFTEDEGVFYGLEEGTVERLPSTNLIQTYLDLLYFGGRSKEAADALLEQKIKPIWAEHNLLPPKNDH